MKGRSPDGEAPAGSIGIRKVSPSAAWGGIVTVRTRTVVDSPVPPQWRHGFRQSSPRPAHAEHAPRHRAETGNSSPHAASSPVSQTSARTGLGASSCARNACRTRVAMAATDGKSMATSSAHARRSPDLVSRWASVDETRADGGRFGTTQATIGGITMPATIECPMCGESMRLRVRQATDRIPGLRQAVTRTVREWYCPGCDYYEEEADDEAPRR